MSAFSSANEDPDLSEEFADADGKAIIDLAGCV